MAIKTEQQSLLDSILGNADPGEHGTTDLSNQDRSPPDDMDDVDNEDQGQEQDDDTVGDEPDERETREAADDDEGDADPNEDEISRAAREASSKGREQQQQDKTQQGNKDPFAYNAKLTRDNQGNLLHNGKIVARAGREARMFMEFRGRVKSEQQSAQRAFQQVTKMAAASRELFARYDELKKSKSALDGFEGSEVQDLLAVATAYKKNPVDGIKLMLTKAHLAGVDISKLGVAGGLDPKVLLEEMKNHVTATIKPVLARNAVEANEGNLRAEATEFFDRNPEAREVSQMLGGAHVLAKVLKGAKQQAPDLTLDELFQRLHYEILKHGVPTTAPVGRRSKSQDRRRERRQDTNFRRTVQKNPNPSFDDIGASVLQDLADLANVRGQ